MKNLLFILALLPGLAFAASSDSLYWTNAAANNNMNDPANYTEGVAGSAAAEIAATDTLFFAAGSAAATASGNISVANVVTTAGYSGAWSIDGYTLTTSTNGPAFDHTGTAHFGSGITCNGASATFHVGSGVGTITATSCALTMNGTTGMVIDVDKIVTYFKSCQLGVSAKCTNSGAQTLDTRTLVMGNNSKLTRTTAVSLTINTPGTAITLGSGCVLDGVAKLTIWFDANVTFTLCNTTLPITGTGITRILSAKSGVTGVCNLSSNLSTEGGFQLRAPYENDSFTFNTNDNDITCGSLDYGISNATSSLIINFGSSAVTVASLMNSFNTAPTTGACNINFQTSTWSCSGNWTFGSNHTVNPGTSIVTLNGSGAQTITSAGKSFYDMTVNNSGAAFVALADSLTCNDLTLTDGPFNTASYGISAVDMIYTSADSTRFQSLWLTGDLTRGALADKSDTAGQHIRFSAGASHTMAAAGKTYASVTTSGPLTITGGATIATLSYGVDGIPVTIATGTTLTAGTVIIGGTTEAPDTIQGAGAGATLDLTGNQTVTWADPVYVKDMALAAGDTVTLTAGIDGGGNTGAWIFPSSATTRRNRGWLGLGVWIRP